MGFHMAHNAASKAADAFAKVTHNFNVKEPLVGICVSTCKGRVLKFLSNLNVFSSRNIASITFNY